MPRVKQPALSGPHHKVPAASDELALSDLHIFGVTSAVEVGDTSAPVIHQTPFFALLERNGFVHVQIMARAVYRIIPWLPEGAWLQQRDG